MPLCPVDGCRHHVDESEVLTIIDRGFAEGACEQIPRLNGKSRDRLHQMARAVYMRSDSGDDWEVEPRLIDGGRCKMYRITAEEAYITVGRENNEFNQIAAQFSKLCQIDVKKVREVHKVEYDANSPVLRAYNQKKQEFRTQSKPIKEILVFHGTGTEANFDSICSLGFKVGGQGGVKIVNGAAHGHGVYTAIGKLC